MQGQTSSKSIDPVVFWVAAAISAVFVLWGVLTPQALLNTMDTILNGFVIPNLGWAFVLASFGFLAFVVYLAVSRFGKIRLGGDDERPEFSTISWVAMMFSAGMGIGMMFYGVQEPLSHFINPPFGLAEPGTRDAAQTSIEYTFFHWALHPWAIYAVLGLALAYFTFRRGMPNLISTAFYPLLGDRVYGPIGRGIDIFAVFATLFGSATSLGLGAKQVGGGLNYLTGSIPNTTTVAIIIIAVLTLAFVLSAVSGVHRGIQWLSNTNMVLAIILLVFLFFAGGAVYIMNTFTTGIGGYAANLIPMSFRTAVSGDSEFLSTWTIFYWAWWISWAPFVGTFIARISRGRTIREFVIGVLLVPSTISFVWYSITGGAAINQALSGNLDAAQIAGAASEVALFSTLDTFPLSGIMSIIAIVLVALFFVSGADAASVVMGMLTSKGSISPRRWNIVVWGILTGAVAAIALLAGGGGTAGLDGLQYMALIAGAPFTVIMIGLCVSLFKALKNDTALGKTSWPRPDQPANRPWEIPHQNGGAPEPGRAMSGAGSVQQMSAQSLEDIKNS